MRVARRHGSPESTGVCDTEFDRDDAVFRACGPGSSPGPRLGMTAEKQKAPGDAGAFNLEMDAISISS